MSREIPLRRRDRKMPDDKAKKFLKQAPFVYMSTTDPDGSPYCVPVNLVMTDDETAYIHGMAVGHKIDNIRNNPNICLTYAENDGTIASDKTKEGFILAFQSVVAFGTIEQIFDEEEKEMMLTKLCLETLSKELEAYNHIQESVKRSAKITAVYKIHITSVCGKQNLNIKLETNGRKVDK